MSLPEVVIHGKTFVVKIDADTIATRVKELAAEISKEFDGKKPLLIGVLNGSAIFTVDLFREIPYDCEVTFIRVASYHSGMSSSGEVKQVMGLKESIKGRHVIVVEDIVDSGETAKHLMQDLQQHEPATLKLATALFKPAALKHDVRPDYVGFVVEPDFLVGYGLDYDGLGRNLKDIYVLKP
ncbi:MAG: hypoxanthine phosphoribosyltransferase [Bacteroidota bacterium]|jgi:hypoxanthine phosphoribosyltransferase